MRTTVFSSSSQPGAGGPLGRFDVAMHIAQGAPTALILEMQLLRSKSVRIIRVRLTEIPIVPNTFRLTSSQEGGTCWEVELRRFFFSGLEYFWSQ